MLQLLVKGLFLWIYDLLLQCVSYIGDVLLDVFRMDTAYFINHAPVVLDLQYVLIGTGWALLLGNLVFQALRGMVSGIGVEAEDPKILFCKTSIFAFLLVASPQICKIGLDLTSNIISFMELPESVVIASPEESWFDFSAGWLLAIICGIIILFQVFKLFFEIGERYVVVCILTFFAPLAFSMGGSRSTEDIFKSWCRMFASMCFVSVTNIFFLKIIFSAMSRVPNTVTIIPWLIFISGLCKVARRIDDIVCRLGLNAAHTGREHIFPGYLLATVMRSAASAATNTARTHWSQAQSFHGEFGGSNTNSSPTAYGSGQASSRAAQFFMPSGQRLGLPGSSSNDEGSAQTFGGTPSPKPGGGGTAPSEQKFRPQVQGNSSRKPFPRPRGSIDIFDDESAAQEKSRRTTPAVKSGTSVPTSKSQEIMRKNQNRTHAQMASQRKRISDSPQNKATTSDQQKTVQQWAQQADRPPLHRMASADSGRNLGFPSDGKKEDPSSQSEPLNVTGGAMTTDMTYMRQPTQTFRPQSVSTQSPQIAEIQGTDEPVQNGMQSIPRRIRNSENIKDSRYAAKKVREITQKDIKIDHAVQKKTGERKYVSADLRTANAHQKSNGNNWSPRGTSPSTKGGTHGKQKK